MGSVQLAQDDPISSPYKQLEDEIRSHFSQKIDVNAADLLQRLEQHLEDMKNLVVESTKSDASREKLKKNEPIQLDDTIYTLNDEFKQESIQLSDDLSIDEIEAAKLFRKGMEASARLDRSPFKSAVLIYHTRQQQLLNLILTVFTYAGDDAIPADCSEVFKDVSARLIQMKVRVATAGMKGANETYFRKCLSSMEFLRRWYYALQQKELNKLALGGDKSDDWEEFLEDLHLQRRSIMYRHETLSLILCALIEQKKVVVSDFKDLYRTYPTLEKYDVLVVHNIAPTYAFINLVCSQENSFVGFAEVVALHKELKQLHGSQKWPIKELQAAVWVWWLSELNGLIDANQEDRALVGMSRKDDIDDPVKAALNDGAFRYVLSLTAGICRNPDMNENQDELLKYLQGTERFETDYELLSDGALEKLVFQLELFIEFFVTNMANVLRELKIKEEEAILMQMPEIDLNLERFLFIICYLFHGREDSALAFWSDPDNNLHGFLVWASQRQTSLMETVYCYMLASLAYGSECSAACHAFLLGDAVPGTAKYKKSSFLSWDLIFKNLRDFYQSISPVSPLKVTPSIQYGTQRPLQTPTEPPPASLEATYATDSALRLITRLSKLSPVAQEWFAQNFPGVPFFDFLYSLLTNTKTPPKLFPSIFSCIASFVDESDAAANDEIWRLIDEWALAPLPPNNNWSLSSMGALPSAVPQSNNASFMDAIAKSAYASEAFVQLLNTLLKPSATSSLRDELGFPETLGSSRTTITLAGIDPYVDFILNGLFGQTTRELFQMQGNGRQNLTGYSLMASMMKSATAGAESNADPTARLKRFDSLDVQMTRVLLTCLEFVHVNLASFNEELLIYAADSNISVDKAVRTSDLKAYLELHPFARVVEHLLSEKLVKCIFALVSFGAKVLNELPPTSPFVLVIVQLVEVLDMAMTLQPVYVEVRRIIETDDLSGRLKHRIMGCSRFEDAVLYHLDFVVQLGLLVGMGIPRLTTSALSLLEKLAVSPRLVDTNEWNLGRHLRANRVLNAVQSSEQSRQVIYAFIDLMQGPGDEVEVKIQVLRFLERCLGAANGEASLAHVLLGFEVTNEGIELSTNEGGVGSGVSLFHSILDITNSAGPETGNPAVVLDGKQLELRDACFRVLKALWKGARTWEDTRHVLRANKFLFHQWMLEVQISMETLWGLPEAEGGMPSFASAEFWRTPAAQYFYYFLRRRAGLFDYVAVEIRQLAFQGAATMVSKYLATLLGSTVVQGERVQNVHVLDLLDFLELGFPREVEVVGLEPFQGVEFGVCRVDGNGTLDLEKVRTLLLLKKAELCADRAVPAEVLAELDDKVDEICAFVFERNQHILYRVGRLEALHAWCTLIQVMLDNCEFETTTKLGFILLTLQSVMPKLESFCLSDIDAAEELSALVHGLVSHISWDASMFAKGNASDLAHDRLYQLFRCSLRCLQSPLASVRLREDFYNVAYRYLKGIEDAVGYGGGGQRRHSIETVKASGERLLEVVCNDAYSGEGGCKVVALLLLESLVGLGEREGTGWVVEGLVRRNFLVVLLGSVAMVGGELHEATTTGSVSPNMVMLSFQAKTAFLLKVAATRQGAGHLLSSNLFGALRDSRIFAVDPDLGFALNDPLSLQKYHTLLLCVLRIVTSCIVSRGPQNQHAIKLGLQFCAETRAIAVSIFKKVLGIGGKGEEGNGLVRELADLWCVLMDKVGFVEYEESQAPY
ncbi:hypothetical protein BJ508DRAFT_366368 [Ascobolus immersus RN42]|uniref:Nucleoporin n=1 Tax=Ascobolus immersus RN42 TaxID=1160509 RepID=A0A3N4HNU1_ASCIM|nr:hypothetical protein BJ508DRAFT_366368 [Ascobolus immersus RN42]